MLDQKVLRWGGLAAMAGAVTMFGVRIYSIAHITRHHPKGRVAQEADPLVSELQDLAGNTGWLVAHWAAALGAGLLLFGIVAIALSFRDEPARSWARIALALAIGGVVVLGMNVGANVALQGHGDVYVADPTEANLAAAQGASIYATTVYVALLATLYGGAAALLGVMTLSSNAGGRSIGWLAVAGGLIGIVISTVLHFESFSRLTATYIPALARTLFYLWAFISGWRLWSSSSTLDS